jgi:hypothetical protein
MQRLKKICHDWEEGMKIGIGLEHGDSIVNQGYLNLKIEHCHA